MESLDTVEVERNGRDQSVGFRRSRPKLSGRNPTRSANDEHAVASKLGEIPLLVHRRIELVGRDAVLGRRVGVESHEVETRARK